MTEREQKWMIDCAKAALTGIAARPTDGITPAADAQEAWERAHFMLATMPPELREVDTAVQVKSAMEREFLDAAKKYAAAMRLYKLSGLPEDDLAVDSAKSAMFELLKVLQ